MVRSIQQLDSDPRCAIGLINGQNEAIYPLGSSSCALFMMANAIRCFSTPSPLHNIVAPIHSTCLTVIFVVERLSTASQDHLTIDVRFPDSLPDVLTTYQYTRRHQHFLTCLILFPLPHFLLDHILPFSYNHYQTKSPVGNPLSLITATSRNTIAFASYH